MISNRSRSRVLRTVAWIAGVLLVFAVAALAGFSAYQRANLLSQAARLTDLERRVSEMKTDQRLLAEIVAAGTTTQTAAATAPATGADVPPPTASGTRRLFGTFRKVAKSSQGWDIEFDPSEYVTGTPAFALASSMGKLTNPDGSFILDTSARTIPLRLLKDARVTVLSWSGASKPAPTISATQLVSVLSGGTAADPAFAKVWFWVDVRDGYVLQVTQQGVK
jgi:hypothetical protein